MTTKNRLNKIEQAQGTGVKKKYICFITNGIFGDKHEDYKVQAYPVNQGGTGGENIHFDTRAELDGFGKRADVDLDIVEIVCSEQAVENAL